MTPKIAIYGLWMLWLLVWWALAPWGAHLKTEKHIGWKHEVLFRGLTLVGFVLLFGLYGNAYDLRYPLWHRLPSTIGWLVAALALAGFALALWGRIRLGPLWSATIARKTGQYVVDRGPYAAVRHPICCGVIVSALATAATFGIPSSVAGATLIIAALVVKTHIEESFLRAETNGGYDDYAERVAMFVPGFNRLKAAWAHRYGQAPRDGGSLRE
jgi:protein-S-isoprenylcysteine O-methyltransferase Ste14